MRLHGPRRGRFIASPLLYARGSLGQRQAAVKPLGSNQPAGGPWPWHQDDGFRGPRPGTAASSLRRSACQHLTGKGLTYLRRVSITPAVYGPFAPLDGGFRYPHWAGVGGCTNPLGVAAAYVFIKQSARPCHCDLRSQVSKDPRPQAPLLPKLRGQFAEFPSPGWPARLRLLTQGHPCRFSVRSPGIVLLPLFMGSGHQPKGHMAPIPGFCPVLVITTLPGLIPVSTEQELRVGLARSVGGGASVAGYLPGR